MHHAHHPLCYIGELGSGMPVNRDMPNIGPRLSIVTHEGKLVARVGHLGPGTGPGQFLSPHGLAVDSHSDIYVGEVSYTNWGNTHPASVPTPPFLRSLRKLVKVA